MGFAVATNLFFAGVLTLIFPRLNHVLNGDTGTLGLFAGFNLIALASVFLWVPETAKRTLEDLSQIFSIPTRRHAAYQIRTYIPWFIESKILRHKEVELRTIYLEGGDESNDSDSSAECPQTREKEGSVPQASDSPRQDHSVHGRRRASQDSDGISLDSSIHG